tara:strand:+ start:380754 stop:381773 length:1020 start_codon:yes stop_codon:yes gene_type:complete
MRYRLKGQAMAEYVIVCAGLMMSLYAIGSADCGDNGRTTSCASRLLSVLHDNYDGYSSSISGVQQYGEYAAKGAYTPDPDGGGNGGNTGGTGGSIGGGLNPDGLTDVNQITTSDGFGTFGNLQADGTVLDANGDVIGFYSDADNTFTDINGNTVSAAKRSLVLDEQGNILHLQAVTPCTGLPSPFPRSVYSWAYVSKATGKAFNSLNKNPLDISGLCTQASFKVVKNGQEQGGRILNSEYFASIFAVDVSTDPLPKTGDVVYWTDLKICSVMAPNWDADIDPDNDKTDEEKYAARLALFGDPDRNLGQLDIIDYFTQVGTDPSKKQPNDCPTVNIISQP